jgi:DNA-binding transcriptional ArsR family regulator
LETRTARRPGQSGKSIEEIVAYAVGHRVRVQILIALRDGDYSTAELAEMIGEPLNKVANHVRELADAGSIEIADSRQRRNTVQHLYRAVSTPHYSKAEIEAMTRHERQVTAGLVIQSLFAEVMDGLWAGKMSDDPEVMLIWERLNLDEQGRRDAAAEQEASWRRLQEIQAESLTRAAEAEGETMPYIAAVLGFERARRQPNPSRSADGE